VQPDIVANLSSPYVGEVINIAVAADGANTVTLIAGTNVTIKTSASNVAGNTTLTMYCELDNITSGMEEVTIYRKLSDVKSATGSFSNPVARSAVFANSALSRKVAGYMPSMAPHPVIAFGFPLSFFQPT